MPTITMLINTRPIIKEDGAGPDSKVVVEADSADDQVIKADRKVMRHLLDVFLVC